MSDIHCVICGEPWDAYGVRHGDMLPWEADLFRKGAGCPGCQGVKPESGQWGPRSIFALENGDEDEGDRLTAHEAAATGTAPAWKRPDPVILWTCEGCGVTVIRNPDDGALEYDLPRGAKGAAWYNSHPYWKGCPEETPAYVFEGEPPRPVCEFCLSHCDHCGGEISDCLDVDDPYDPGASFPSSDGHGSYCVECYGSICEGCGGVGEDCTCHEEDEEDEEDEEEEEEDDDEE